jgi:signal peptidase II
MPKADADGDPGADRQPRRRPAVLLVLAVAVVAIGLDLLTKTLAVAHLDPTRPKRILGGLIYLSLGRNSGAAFGMATGMTAVIAIVAVVVAVAIVRISRRLYSVPWAVGLGLILGGAVGNLLDRVFRDPGFLRGAVVDFISVFAAYGRRFPVFNLADSAITVGAVIIAITALLGIEFDGSRPGKRSELPSDSSAKPSTDD